MNEAMVFIYDMVIKTCCSDPLTKASDPDESIHDLVKVKLWPNPSETTFNLELVSETELGNVKVSVFESSHKLVHSGVSENKDTYAFGANFQCGADTVELGHA